MPGARPGPASPKQSLAPELGQLRASELAQLGKEFPELPTRLRGSIRATVAPCLGHLLHARDGELRSAMETPFR
jgi:hypothetical protein